MANSYFTNPIRLDDFSAAIDVRSSCGYATGFSYFKILKVVWETPTNTSHTAVITDKPGGLKLFSQKCTVENQSVIEYPNSTWDNICIAVGGVGSGAIVITLE